MPLEDFLNAAKRGNIQKLLEELHANPNIINDTTNEGLLSGHTAIEFAAAELRIETVIYLLSSGAVFRDDSSYIINNLLTKVGLNREIARIKIFAIMLNHGVGIEAFHDSFPGARDIIDIVHSLRHSSTTLHDFNSLNDFQFYSMIFRDEEANTDPIISSSQSTNHGTNSTSSQDSGDDHPHGALGGAHPFFEDIS